MRRVKIWGCRGSRTGLPLALVVFSTCCSEALAADFKTVCERLVEGVPDAGRVTEATFVPTGPVALSPPGPSGATAPAPGHCLIRGRIDERIGVDGKPYAIGYEVRLPATWNGKFIFEGGGGSDGVFARPYPRSSRSARRSLTRCRRAMWPPLRTPDTSMSRARLVPTCSDWIQRRAPIRVTVRYRRSLQPQSHLSASSTARHHRALILPAVPMVDGRPWPLHSATPRCSTVL